MRRKQMRRNELPDTCLSTLPSTGQLIVLKHGVRGYYRSEWDTGNRAENRDIADSHNRRRGITDIQETAMMAGSMFGWDTPGADPQWYLDHAKYGNSAMIKGYIKDPIMSVYYPVIGFLLRYKILGREKMYLPVSALSKELLGARSQFVMQPDLVCGVPMMPVKAQQAQNGSYTMELESGSYAFMRYENAKGKLRAAHYRKAFAGVLAPNMTLEELYRKHNADTRPFYRQMRSLSESDVIVVKRGSKRNAYYVDAVGFQEVPSFLKGLQKLKERGEAR